MKKLAINTLLFKFIGGHTKVLFPKNALLRGRLFFFLAIVGRNVWF